MRRRENYLILFALSLTLICTTVLVNARPMYGEMMLYFMAPGPTHPDYGPPVWSGTITGDINGNMYFYNWGMEKDVGQAHFFWETWLITDTEGGLMLMGVDNGVVSWSNDKYRMNGVVTDAGPGYEHLVGRNVHMSGYITWENIGTPEEPVMIPETAPGTFRVN